MLFRTSQLERSRLRARDGRIGKIETFLFDEEQWVLRYIVAKHGFAFLGKRVLISPMSVTGALRDGEAITVGLTRKQVKNAPSADLAQPVSRQKEAELLRYYRVPVYWGGAGLWGGALTPVEAGSLASAPGPDEQYLPETDAQTDAQTDAESHLRSTREVTGYRLRAPEEEVGSVTDFLIEDTTWAVRYLRVETRAEIGGGSLFISPHWVREISWGERTILIDTPLEQLRNVPATAAEGRLSREEEEHLHELFGKARYWK